MECYGKYYRHRAECPECRWRKWCAQAADPAMLGDRMAHYNEVLGENYSDSLRHPGEVEPPGKNPAQEIRYSREDLYQVIRAMMRLDVKTLEILDAKLQEPEVTFMTLGRRKHVSRQYIYSHIKTAMRRIPGLRTIFKVRPSEC